MFASVERLLQGFLECNDTWQNNLGECYAALHAFSPAAKQEQGFLADALRVYPRLEILRRSANVQRYVEWPQRLF